MRRLECFAVVALIFALGASLAVAQSSGSFNASGTGAACAIGTGGDFNGGVGDLSLLSTTVQTSNGQGVTLLIRPSLVTGLFTNTKITTSIPSASADVGIEVCVTVDNSSKGVFPKDADGNACVIYDQRFQQIKSNLFSQLSECTPAPTTTTCNADADCAGLGTGFTCSIPTGETQGVCVAPLNESCDFDLISSTLSAHSFDFVAQVSNGLHTIRASWKVIGEGAVDPSKVNSCVGPGVLTVTQTKVFKQNGSLSF